MISCSREDAVSMFAALGYKTAAKWKPPQMRKHVAELIGMVKNDAVDESEDLGDGRLNDLFGAFVAEARGGGEIEVVKGGETCLVGAEADAKPLDEPPEEPTAEDLDEPIDAELVDEEAQAERLVGDDSDEEAVPAEEPPEEVVAVDHEEQPEEVAEPVKPKRKRGGPLRPTAKPKKVGVIVSIEEFLRGASSGEPLGKKAICEKLASRFPERSPDSMGKTVNVQVPTRLAKDKGCVVQKNEGGYWIEN